MKQLKYLKAAMIAVSLGAFVLTGCGDSKEAQSADSGTQTGAGTEAGADIDTSEHIVLTMYCIGMEADKGAFMDITELFPAYVPLTYKEYEEKSYLDTTKVNGKLYMVPTNSLNYTTFFYNYREDLKKIQLSGNYRYGNL